jgi:hypothetical protein
MLENELEKLEDIVVDGVDMTDYPEMTDAFICSAKWIGGEALTDEELETLHEEKPEYVYEKVMESLH